MQGFRQDLDWYDLFLCPQRLREPITLQRYDIELQGSLKTKLIFSKANMIAKLKIAS